MWDRQVCCGLIVFSALLLAGISLQAAPTISASVVDQPWPRPCLLAPTLPARPTLDGQADAGVWDRVDPTPLAYPLGENQLKKADTSFRAGHLEGVLYVLMEYRWPDRSAPNAQVRERDGKVWADDGGELFFSPLSDRGAVRHLLFNLAGSQMDGRATYNEATEKLEKRNFRWNPDWRIACKETEGLWRVEMAIPLAELGLSGAIGEAFRFDIVRTLPKREPSIMHWAPVMGRSNCRPEFFGIVVLTGPDSKKFSADQLAAGALEGLVFPESRMPLKTVPGATVACKLLNPLARVLPKGLPLDLRISLVDAAGRKKVAKDLRVKQWPHRFAAGTLGLPEGKYSLIVRSTGGKPLQVRIPVSLHSSVIVEAEDRLACRKTGRHNIYIYPRTVGRKVVVLRKGASLSTSGYGRAVYLRLPLLFQPPGPHYGNWISAKMRWKIDEGPWHELAQAAASREVPLAENLEPAEHRVTIESLGDSCCIDGLRFSAEPVGAVSGLIVTDDYSELLVDARAELFLDGALVRTDYVRSPHNGRFALFGLRRGKYRMRLTAAGWEPRELTDVVLSREGEKVDVGVITVHRSERCYGGRWLHGPRYGHTVNVQPGGSFTVRMSAYGKGAESAALVSRFKSVPLEIKHVEMLKFGRYNSIADFTFEVPASAPLDMYDLKVTYKGRWGSWTPTFGQAVCVREQMPKTFHIAGCGHMNTWGQKTSEYLARVAETAELAGARFLLISNEVNAAYISGGLIDLRIPYAVTHGNHTMGRWEDFYDRDSTSCDDGPMRIVTFGEWPFRSWRLAEELIKGRADATNRVLLCYEHIAPIELIREGEVDLLFDAHSSGSHHDFDKFPKGTLGFRAPNQHSLRWIPMNHEGLDPSIKSVKDVPVLDVPREGPIPLRVEYSAPNDGTAASQEARVTNDYETAFPAGRLRLVMKKGNYRVTGARRLQSFDSDDGKFTILDAEAAFPVRKVVTVKALPEGRKR